MIMHVPRGRGNTQRVPPSDQPSWVSNPSLRHLGYRHTMIYSLHTRPQETPLKTPTIFISLHHYLRLFPLLIIILVSIIIVFLLLIIIVLCFGFIPLNLSFNPVNNQSKFAICAKYVSWL